MTRAGVDTTGLSGHTDGFSVRRAVRGCCRRLLRRTATELGARDLKRSALVFSPHFDDETLGCGGTILRKKRAGARVKIVFLTDGSKSHSQFVSEDELREMRTREGFAAARALGVDTEDVLVLGFEETRLQEHSDAAVRRVDEILRKERPQDVFVPYHRDPLPDHVASHRIVWDALQAYGEDVTVYEYPIWFWRQWPWTSTSDSTRCSIRRAAKECIISCIGLLGECRWRVCIADVIRKKRAALEQYRSQMTRLNSDLRWPTLADVSDGEFLECFFQAHERFSKRVFRGRRGSCPT